MIMQDPESFSSAVATVIERHPDGPLHEVLSGMLIQHGRNQRRRAEVLRHEDLRERLRQLGWDTPTNWNGYVPPAFINRFSDEELCRSTGHQGTVRYNQRARYAIGEQPNDSPIRAAMVEISAEAWARRQASDGSAGTSEPTPPAPTQPPSTTPAAHEPQPYPQPPPPP